METEQTCIQQLGELCSMLKWKLQCYFGMIYCVGFIQLMHFLCSKPEGLSHLQF